METDFKIQTKTKTANCNETIDKTKILTILSLISK